MSINTIITIWCNVDVILFLDFFDIHILSRKLPFLIWCSIGDSDVLYLFRQTELHWKVLFFPRQPPDTLSVVQVNYSRTVGIINSLQKLGNICKYWYWRSAKFRFSAFIRTMCALVKKLPLTSMSKNSTISAVLQQLCSKTCEPSLCLGIPVGAPLYCTDDEISSRL